MRCAWLLLVAACGSSKTAPATVGPYNHPSGDDHPAARTPTKALDGRLRIQPPPVCSGEKPEPGYKPPPLAPANSAVLEIAKGTMYTGTPPLTTVTTDKAGNFAVDLPAATYCITLQGRGPKPTDIGENFDLDCLVKTWQTCDAVVEVPVKTVVAIDRVEPCSWSVCYHGPPPP